VVRGLTNKAQLLFLIFNFIKKPGGGSGRTNIKFPAIGNTCLLWAILNDHSEIHHIVIDNFSFDILPWDLQTFRKGAQLDAI
jgi:hypothetical protein